MLINQWLAETMDRELGTLLSRAFQTDLQENLRLYALYDGDGQKWETKKGLEYTPTARVTNHIKHLIKEEARFMLSRTPEIAIVPSKEGEDNARRCAALEQYVRQTLEENRFASDLSKAGRDAFIGKRVLMRLTAREGKYPLIQFRPSIEFAYDVDASDEHTLTKLINVYHLVISDDPMAQRTTLQYYRMKEGACVYDECVVDGNGAVVETRAEGQRLALDYIPAYVIVNDGLTGDLIGESDVRDIAVLNDAYNRTTSDDADALRFNMFPQSVFTDASQASLENIKIAPHALIDLQTEPSVVDKQAKAQIMETQFSYDARIEHALDRLLDDMYRMLSIPRTSVEDYKGMSVSGKALKALYWPLITRCEEKWTAWDDMLKFLVRALYDIATASGQGKAFAGAEYTVRIEHLYPITDEEEEERALDLREVVANARSRKSYIEKWQADALSEDELKQIIAEKRMSEERYEKP